MRGVNFYLELALVHVLRNMTCVSNAVVPQILEFHLLFSCVFALFVFAFDVDCVTIWMG